MLYHLCYVSTASCALDGHQLADILKTARAENARRGITGLLLYKQGSFMQVLEGSREAVMAVFERIAADARHTEVEVLFEEEAEKREFADWSMAFVDLDGVDAAHIPGFSDFMESEEEPRRFLQELTRAKRFLLLFRAVQ